MLKRLALIVAVLFSVAARADDPIAAQLRQEREQRGRHFVIAGAAVTVAGSVAGAVASIALHRGNLWELDDAGCTATCKENLAYNHRVTNAVIGGTLATAAIGGGLMLWGWHLLSQ